MAFAGSTEPCAHVTVMSIGNLGNEINIRIASEESILSCTIYRLLPIYYRWERSLKMNLEYRRTDLTLDLTMRRRKKLAGMAPLSAQFCEIYIKIYQ